MVRSALPLSLLSSCEVYRQRAARRRAAELFALASVRVSRVLGFCPVSLGRPGRAVLMIARHGVRCGRAHARAGSFLRVALRGLARSVGARLGSVLDFQEVGRVVHRPVDGLAIERRAGAALAELPKRVSVELGGPPGAVALARPVFAPSWARAALRADFRGWRVRHVPRLFLCHLCMHVSCIFYGLTSPGVCDRR